MSNFRDGRGWIVARGLVFLFLSSLTPQLGLAQAAPATPTPEQIEVFRNLPPDQQRTVLEAVTERSGASRREDESLPDPNVTAPLESREGTPLERIERGPPRIEGGATLVLEVSVKNDEEETNPDLAATLAARQARIVAGNPYHLDRDGRLSLPALPPIPLAGLTARQAEQRLNAEPRLARLTFKVQLLPVAPVGAEALKPFGYDVFREVPTTFAPANDIPVPPDYAIGPGDRVRLEYFGKRSSSYSLVVDREGRIHVPDIGPVQVAGLSFDEVRSEIEQRVASELIGIRASVSMGPLRSIRIFVVGDVVRPGSYTVSALSSVTHALFTSGGVSEVGSLRDIQLKRAGATVARLDLYDLLLHGNAADDLRLQSGDVVFVPPLGATAGAGGRVRRPAIYEIRSGASVADLVELAGGITPDADARAARVERIDDKGNRVVLDVDLTTPAGRELKLRAGDVLTVPQVPDELARGVTLEGHVLRPGKYAWHEGMRLTDLLGSLTALKFNADQRYVLIRREEFPSRRIQVLSADAIQAFAAPGTDADPLLRSRDRVIVLELRRDRGPAIADLIEEVRLQARDNQPVGIVSVSGRVRAPGQYPLEPGMTVSDLVRAGGGLDEAAYKLTAELARLQVVDGQQRATVVSELQLSELLTGSAATDVPLQPYDTLVIKEIPEWAEQGTVRLLGEVRFPGEYPVRKGETLSSVVERAGGLTEHAFPEGAVFTREEIKAQEQKQIEQLASRLQNDLALLALQGAQAAGASSQNAGEALAVGQQLLTQLRAARPVGRLVIDLNKALTAKGSDEDVQLRKGDTLTVPPLRQYVAVIGEVQNPTSHVWRRGLDRNDYLGLSGGVTDKADEKRIYVVRADGSVVARNSGRWFHSGNVDIRPGDTIVVPLDTQKMRPLTLWTAVTTIIYNLAVSVAAIGSL